MLSSMNCNVEVRSFVQSGWEYSEFAGMIQCLVPDASYSIHGGWRTTLESNAEFYWGADWYPGRNNHHREWTMCQSKTYSLTMHINLGEVIRTKCAVGSEEAIKRPFVIFLCTFVPWPMRHENECDTCQHTALGSGFQIAMRDLKFVEQGVSRWRTKWVYQWYWFDTYQKILKRRLKS